MLLTCAFLCLGTLAGSANVPDLYTMLSSDTPSGNLPPHQVNNFIVDIHSTSGDVLVGGLIKLESQ